MKSKFSLKENWLKVSDQVIDDENKKKNKEKEEKPKADKMCRPDVYNTECDSGVGPAGNPLLILFKKGGINKRLLEEISKHMVNLPADNECNIITRTCDNNSIEITTRELQIMIKSLEDKAMSVEK